MSGKLRHLTAWEDHHIAVEVVGGFVGPGRERSLESSSGTHFPGSRQSHHNGDDSIGRMGQS